MKINEFSVREGGRTEEAREGERTEEEVEAGRQASLNLKLL